MLHRLEIENFYSIRDAQVIDLRATGHAPNDPARLAPLWRGSSEKAPKVVALFGPNASGKTNVLRALAFAAWFMRDSFAVPPDSRLPFERFNDTESLEAPTRLAVHFSGPEHVEQVQNAESAQCRYVFEVVIGGASQHAVLSETLHYWPSRAARKVRLFERDAEGSVAAAKAFGLAGYRQALTKVLRPNVSVISTLAQLKHPLASRLRTAASLVVSNVLIERSEGSEDQVIQHYADNPKLVEVFNREVARVDFGIRALELHSGPHGPLALFRHDGLAHPMPLMYESHGTREFMKLYPVLLHVLENGGVAVLDELDAAIHPMILSEILRWFYDPKRNPYDAQLWMSCQSVSLLEELIKEEVLFCDKDSRGRTEVYGLRDIQAVRRKDNYYKKYLGGAYGAIPQIG